MYDLMTRDALVGGGSLSVCNLGEQATEGAALHALRRGAYLVKHYSAGVDAERGAVGKCL